MKTVSFHTLGCKLNYSETSTIGRQFHDRGYLVVDADEPSDIFVLNTCSVTERADRECRQIIRRVLRRSPETYVVVTGCYAQLQPAEIGRIQGVDLILGSKEKFDIFSREHSFEKRAVPQSFVSCIDDAATFDPAFSAEVGGRTRAFLKIQDGCDYVCAFCTIPRARGTSRSGSIASVVADAELLATKGYREIVLTGVNVGDFGRKDGTSLLELLQELERVAGIERIRVSSIEPNLLTPGLIDFMTGSPKICRHFHIPMQSGSDVVLRGMRRRYSAEQYRRTIEHIREADPGAGIGADVIVGFPGESDELFGETVRFIEQLPLSYLHVFSYSEREDTPAPAFAGSVAPRTRQARSELLRTLSRMKRRAFHESLIGETCDVLFERVAGRGSSGFTSTYARVDVRSSESIEGIVRPVTITGADEERCTGILAGQSSHHIEGECVANSSLQNFYEVNHIPQEAESA